MPSNTVITILGKKGSGKTTLTRQIAQEQNRVIFFDANGEYDAQHICWGYQECIETLVKTEEEKYTSLSLRCYDTKESIALMGLCFHLNNTWLVIDEASLYCSPVSMPTEIGKLVRFGRHKELSLIVVARRASEIPRDITANSDIVISFAQREPRDVAYLNACQTGFGNKASLLKEGSYRFVAFGSRDKAPLIVLHRLREQRESA